MIENKRTLNFEKHGIDFVDAIDVFMDLSRIEFESIRDGELRYQTIGSVNELSTFCRQLKLTSSDGKSYSTDCANTETLFRIIQSIPSPKAEPFKRWLAKVGYD